MLDDINKMEEVDKGRLFASLEDFPEQIEEVFRDVELDVLPFDPEHIVVTGMGGSGIAGDILGSLLANKINIPIHVNKDYSLPAFVGKRTLLLVISYSGNTEETVSAAEIGIERGARVVMISSNGKVEDICKENNILLIKAPEGYHPRAAIAFMFIPVLKLLSEMLIYDSDIGIIDSLKVLRQLREEIKAGVPTEKNRAKRIAKKIKGKVPVIYGHSIYNAVANRWHTQLNENSKILSWYGAIPEMNHNELVGWAGDDNSSMFIPIILRDKKEDERIHRRIELTKELAFKNSVENIIEVYAEGETQLARILYLTYMGDYVSIYLGILNGEDPSPVKVIDELKKGL